MTLEKLYNCNFALACFSFAQSVREFRIQKFKYLNLVIFDLGFKVSRENCPPVRIGVSVKVRVGFRVEGQPDNCKLGLILALGGEAIIVEGNCPRTLIFSNNNFNS